MAWLESHQTLRDHPKTIKCAKTLGIALPTVIGYLHMLWWWALDYAQNGDITKFDSDDIEIAVGWDGKHGALYNTLLNCGYGGEPGFLEKQGKRVVIHDWHDYAGKLIERRTEDARRKRATRRSPDDQLSLPIMGEDVQDASSGHPEDGVRSAYVPNPTQPNSTEPDNTEIAISADKPRQTSRSRDMHFENLADLCHLTPPDRNWGHLPKSSSGQLNKYCGELRAVGATPEQIIAFGDWWYANDWRGQKGQTPKPADVAKEWTHFLNGDSGQGNIEHKRSSRIPTEAEQQAHREWKKSRQQINADATASH